MSKKFTELTLLPTPDPTDVLAIVDVSAGTTKKTTAQGVLDAAPAGQWSADQLDADATGHGFLEIGRTTLTPAGDTISVASLPSRKYLRIYGAFMSTGGTITPKLVLNNDTTTANYNRRVSDNHGATSASAGADLFLTDNASANMQYVVVEIVNVASQNKLIMSQGMTDGGDGAAPATRDLIGQWEDSTNIISRIDFVNGGTGDFAIGSEVVVMGRN